MAVLDACRDAIARLVGRRYASVFANEDEICVEIAGLANDAAEDIAKANAWQKMLSQHVIDGDGVTQSWPLPAGYDRMVDGTQIMSGTWHDRRYEHAGTLDAWQDILSLQPTMPPGFWIIIDDKMHFQPKIGVGDSAKFFYVKKYFATDAGGMPKAQFDNDTDIFILRDHLLKLSLIWRWKAMKVMDYAEDLRLYDEALSQEMSRDAGSRVIRSYPSSNNRRWSIAYPWTLGGM